MCSLHFREARESALCFSRPENLDDELVRGYFNMGLEIENRVEKFYSMTSATPWPLRWPDWRVCGPVGT